MKAALVDLDGFYPQEKMELLRNHQDINLIEISLVAATKT